jgi:hypothetical protein
MFPVLLSEFEVAFSISGEMWRVSLYPSARSPIIRLRVSSEFGTFFDVRSHNLKKFELIETIAKNSLRKEV